MDPMQIRSFKFELEYEKLIKLNKIINASFYVKLIRY